MKLPTLSAALQALCRQAEPDPQALAALGLERLGGRNNRVFLWRGGEAPICLKVYRADKRDRAGREWRALEFLAAQLPGLAPRPLWRAPDPQVPLAALEWLPGAPLHPGPPDPAALDGLERTLAQLHAITPARAAYPEARYDPIPRIVARVAAWATRDDVAQEAAATALVRRWRRAGDHELLEGPAPPVFARGDPNLANCLWDGRHLRLVDFEYAGWSDLAAELADLVEHLNARAVPDARWEALLERLAPPDAALRRRLAAARRTYALFWVAMLWPQRGERAAEFAAQVERADALRLEA
ncbi:MAG TPA: aminoglycoside phosphotransferase family protein [Roseiflexaceae bacterium]|nr:aminoglycoside phosphotransferase family protein [Roseiflexaceae bacterium]